MAAGRGGIDLLRLRCGDHAFSAPFSAPFSVPFSAPFSAPSFLVLHYSHGYPGLVLDSVLDRNSYFGYTKGIFKSRV